MTTQTVECTMNELLRSMTAHGASDLHLTVGNYPMIRVNGYLRPMQEYGLMDQALMERMLYPMLDGDQLDRLQKGRNLDLSHDVSGLARFRGNMLWQRGTLGAVFRLIPSRPFTIEELGLPQVLYDLAMKPRGLVLVTGPTGSGKSTSQAAIIDYINSRCELNIVTIEDPIEYLHEDKKCIVRQRELGTDTPAIAEALRYVLRQDPDVILVGEMRDLETIGLAVTAAETGHLVLATLHTSSAAATVDRIIDVFPAGQQQQIRLQLASVLEGVLCQALLPRASGKGRVCAMEIMLGVPAVRNLIRENKSHQLTSVIESSARIGMQSMNMALKKLVEQGVITVETAMERSSTPGSLAVLLGLPPNVDLALR